jgi:hypothetical protein
MRPGSGTRIQPAARARTEASRAGRFHLRTHILPTLAVGLVASVLLLSSSVASASTPARAGGAAPTAQAAAPSGSGECYNINATICLAMQNSTEPDILPALGSHSTSVHPPTTTSIGLYVKSRFNLVWATAHGSGPLSPISLNATGVLWNGVPYYNQTDNSVWHPPGTSWWDYGPTGQNATYPYWYAINFSARAASGAPNFYPGMAITWWVYIVANSSGVLSNNRNSTVLFHFTFGGAWPFSPDVGSPEWGGAASALEDVSVSQWPLIPNFNDSVQIRLDTTSADLVYGASIGGAYVDVNEYAPDGALLNSGTWNFPVNVFHGIGAYATNVTLPSAYSQSPTALVEYRVTSWDTNTYGPDEVVSPVFNYSVNGNGSFRNPSFNDDLGLSGTPTAPQPASASPPTLQAGQPVHLLLSSSNAGTSILAGEVVYSVSYTALGENTTYSLAMDRINSTHFNATIPAMPLNTTVTYTVTAWDFAQDRVTSVMYEYRTPLLSDTLLTVPENSTFFLAYVYDAGTQSWVSGATVQVLGLSGYLHVTTKTLGGIAYPNATGRPFVPEFLPAGESYRIYVNDSSFMPNGGASPSVFVNIVADHTLNGEGVIAVGPSYEVAQSGNAFYFWLNETPPTFTYSAPTGGIGASTALIAALGLGALALVSIPTMLWWRALRARRQAEERRITL